LSKKAAKKRLPPKHRDAPPAKKKKLIPEPAIPVEIVPAVDVATLPNTEMEANESGNELG